MKSESFERPLSAERKRPQSKEAPELEKIEEPEVRAFRVQVEGKVTDTLATGDAIVHEAEQIQIEVLKDLIQSDQTEKASAVSAETKRTKTVLGKLRRKFQKMVPFLLPLMFVAKLKMREADPEDVSFQNRAVAEQQLKRDGITEAQRRAYIPGVSETIYRAITPAGYQSIWDIIRNAPENLLSSDSRVRHAGRFAEIQYQKIEQSDREDAWRLYLGLPQEYSSFGISRYRPQNSESDTHYFSVNNWLKKNEGHFGGEGPSTVRRIVQGIENRALYREIEQKISDAVNSFDEARRSEYSFLRVHEADFEYDNHGALLVESVPLKLRDEFNRLRTAMDKSQNELRRLNDQLQAIRDGIPDSIFTAPDSGTNSVIDNDGYTSSENASSLALMGNYKLSLGLDERGNYISYYDRWDLGKNPVEGSEGLFGRSFEIYDRIYYNPETFEVINLE